MSNTQAEGDELLEFVKMLGELEWARFQERRAVITLNGITTIEDRSTHPPYTTFRFKNEDPAVIQRLQEVVASYQGGVQWVMLGHDRSPLPGTNWTIEPLLVESLRDEARTLGVTVWKVVEQRMPHFGPLAFEDLLRLVGHLRKSW